MDIDWNAELVSQLEFHWENQLRPRLDGLTDDEYFWEPVGGCWNIRLRAESGAANLAGSGDFVMEYAKPTTSPPPVTTIGWRLAHIAVDLFLARAAGHFGGPAADWQTFEYAGSAKQALSQLDAGYRAWITGVRGLGTDGFAVPCGPVEGPYADRSMAELVLHNHREVIHHGAEIALLRDLYLRKGDRDGL